MIYIAIFALSILCFYISEKTQNKYFRVFFAVCGVLIPCILAGLRSSSVGTDVRIYGKYAYNEAVRSDSFFSYYGEFSDSLLGDIGYYLTTYILAKISPHYHLGLFVYSLLTFTFLYLGIRKFNQKFRTPIWLFMGLCYFALYNPSLNLLRQSIAVGILFYAFAEYAAGKKLYGVLFWILAVLFHSSALIGGGLFIIYTYFRQRPDDRWYTAVWKSILFIAAVFGLVILIPVLLRQLVEAGLIRENYLMYLDEDGYRISGSVEWTYIITHFLTVLAILIFYRPLYKRNMNPLFYLMMSLLVLLADYSLLVTMYADRIGLYLVPITLVALANTRKCLTKWIRLVWSCLLLVIYCYQWILIIVIQGFHETYPYEYMWQDNFTDEFITDENRDKWSRN